MRQVEHLLVDRGNPKRLSLVIPVYNEQEVLPILRSTLAEFVPTLEIDTEIILVNDGSSDGSLKYLMEWAREDRSIKVLGLARNFGHQAALTAGIDAAIGDAVVIMDADLQDPPMVIVEMLAQYRRGYDVVYAQRASRDGEGTFKRMSAWAFYRLMRWLIHPDLPVDSGDFRLISRPCLESLKAMRETHRFLRGMVAWVGYPQTAVKFQRPPRAAGETHYSTLKMLRFAWTAAVSFSPMPLRLSFAMGVVIALAGVVEGLYAILRKILGLHVEPGWASIIVVICLVGGGILINIGVLGEYVARIFEEVKGAPLYIVSVTENVDKPGEVKRNEPA